MNLPFKTPSLSTENLFSPEMLNSPTIQAVIAGIFVFFLRIIIIAVLHSRSAKQFRGGYRTSLADCTNRFIISVNDCLCAVDRFSTKGAAYFLNIIIFHAFYPMFLPQVPTLRFYYRLAKSIMLSSLNTIC